MRGEYCKTSSTILPKRGSPPLARGVQKESLFHNRFPRITPACAGSTSSFRWGLLHPRDHPRLCGEYFQKKSRVRLLSGSPPLARGVQSRYWNYSPHFGITPACAGSTACCNIQGALRRDHPRLRGEYLLGRSLRTLQLGSPPLARGVR